MIAHTNPVNLIKRAISRPQGENAANTYFNKVCVRNPMMEHHALIFFPDSRPSAFGFSVSSSYIAWPHDGADMHLSETYSGKTWCCSTAMSDERQWGHCAWMGDTGGLRGEDAAGKMVSGPSARSTAKRDRSRNSFVVSDVTPAEVPATYVRRAGRLGPRPTRGNEVPYPAGAASAGSSMCSFVDERGAT